MTTSWRFLPILNIEVHRCQNWRTLQVRIECSASVHVSVLQCGVSREEDGAVSAVVVVQHHPVIQRRGDKVETAAMHHVEC